MFIKVLVGFLISLSVVASAAVEKSLLIITEVTSKSVEDGGALLRFNIKDAEKKSGVCPYFIESFAFNKDKKELNLKVSQGFCANDRFGISQGDLYWVLPKVAQGEKLCVYVNDKKMGSILVQGNKKTYRMSESCE